MAHPVKLIFLGGITEIGRNLFLLEYEDDIIIVDCGIGFPNEHQVGVDLVLPDITYLRERAHKIRGIFLTHGHEDHIGALEYLVADLPGPLYATGLTAGLIRVKLEEVGLAEARPVTIFDPDQHPILTAGVFWLEPFRVTHSIPDTVGFGISTPAGLIVHTADFKLDPTPIDDRPTDFETLERFRQRGVRLLISDCVHIEAAGRTPSERVVGETFGPIFAAAPGRIFVATFASQIARIQQVLDTATSVGRSVVVLGRSMEKNVRVSLELGYLQDPGNVIVAARDAVEIPDDKLVYVVTGSQGEPMAVLGRIASGDHREVKLGDGDTVIISATPIPGNETAVFDIINRLFKAGAEVIYSARAQVHVSGHASWDEVGEMLDRLQPQEVIPFHGEYRHMALYADLAVEHGFSAERVRFAELGDVIAITPDRITIEERVPHSYVYVEGERISTVGDIVIRDRQVLSDEGILMVVVAVDRENGQIVAGPEIVTRGFVHAGENATLLNGTRDHVRSRIGEYTDGHETGDFSDLSRQVRDSATKYLFKETGRRPMVLPMVIEV